MGQGVYYSNLITLLSITNFVAFKSLFLFVCLSPGESVRFLWQNDAYERGEEPGKAGAIAFDLSPYFPPSCEYNVLHCRSVTCFIFAFHLGCTLCL